jgi:PTS system glucose-specific IIA component
MIGFFKKKREIIKAPANGETFDIAEVNDTMFSQKLMGDGIALHLKGKRAEIASPADGKLTVLFPTGHSFGVTMQNGIEILIHIGINTVNANGEGFKIMSCRQGDTIKAGQPIVEVDLQKLSTKYDMSTMIIVTNTNGHDIQFKNGQAVAIGDVIASYK